MNNPWLDMTLSLLSERMKVLGRRWGHRSSSQEVYTAPWASQLSGSCCYLSAMCYTLSGTPWPCLSLNFPPRSTGLESCKHETNELGLGIGVVDKVLILGFMYKRIAILVNET